MKMTGRDVMIRSLVGFGLSTTMLAIPIAADAATGATGATGVTTTTIARKGTVATAKFIAAQSKLEAAAVARQAQLVKLTAKVPVKSTLTATDKTTLSSRLATETTNVNAIVMHVMSDTNQAALSADSASLFKDNRVFAVMTPQVNLTVEADAQLARLATDSAELAEISGSTSSVSALITATVGQINTTHDAVLAQTPNGYPANGSIFSGAKTRLQSTAAQLPKIAADIAGLKHAGKMPVKKAGKPTGVTG